MHHPHTDALVIIAKVANSNVHRLLVDDGSTIDIIYLEEYKRMGLIESELCPSTSPLYGFKGDHVIPRGTVKLAVIGGEHPRVLTVVTEFLVVNCPLAVNGIIGIPLLKALNVVTSIYHLTMKFLTTEGMGQVQGSQYDSRESYNKSLRLTVKERKLPQKMEVGKVIVGPSENPRS